MFPYTLTFSTIVLVIPITSFHQQLSELVLSDVPGRISNSRSPTIKQHVALRMKWLLQISYNQHVLNYISTQASLTVCDNVLMYTNYIQIKRQSQLTDNTTFQVCFMIYFNIDLLYVLRHLLRNQCLFMFGPCNYCFEAPSHMATKSAH
jgi:hypothetical protein